MPAFASHLAANETMVAEAGSFEAVSLNEIPVSDQRFRQLATLGEGGMGVVRLVHDRALTRDVAVKHTRDADDREAVTMFLREARIAGRLEHPNIVPVHDVSVTPDGRAELVMKAIEGESIADLIASLRGQGGPDYSIERRIEIALGVLRALEYAHERGVLHRDIKPENVMIGRHGEVLVVDWGIARATGEADIVPPGAIIGTPANMSPEQARGEELDARSDLYSAAVLIHELLTLRHYLGEGDEQPLETMKRVAEEGWRWSLFDWHRPGAGTMPPMELYHFLRRAMAFDRSRRFASAREMISELTRILEGRIRVQCHITLVKSSVRGLGRFVDRFPWPSFALFATLVGLAAYGMVDLATKHLR